MCNIKGSMVIHAFLHYHLSLFLDGLKKTRVIYSYRFFLDVICLFPLLVSTALTFTAHLVISHPDGPFRHQEVMQLLKRRPGYCFCFFFYLKNIKLVL